jgi:GNAT superfamily N-acetyltransferase
LDTQATVLEIAPATAADAPLLLAMIREFAAFEGLEHQVLATVVDLNDALFGPERCAEALIARIDTQAAGFAVYFHSFSTFLGRRGLYLEDLFVRPAFRGRAVGRGLLAHLAGVAVQRGCPRFEWEVLDWNENARGFYASLGAAAHPELVKHRVDGEALLRLAADGSLPRQ